MQDFEQKLLCMYVYCSLVEIEIILCVALEEDISSAEGRVFVTQKQVFLCRTVRLFLHLNNFLHVQDFCTYGASIGPHNMLHCIKH